MRVPFQLTVACLAAALAVARPGAAQETATATDSADASSPALTHIRHVGETFRGTPDEKGLLPTAVAEADIALRHATLAGRDPTDLEAIQTHTKHVLNALDPSKEPKGPGLGYGVIRAAELTAHYVELAAASDGASDGIKTHSVHIATASRNAVKNAEAAVEIAEKIGKAEDAAEASDLLAQLTSRVDAVVNGSDVNGDGRIGWGDDEGGLAQATQHLGLLMRGEGIGG